MRVVGVGGVLTNAAAEVLLVRTAHAGWELPGGRVEPGEDLLEALQREVFEEAGCDLEGPRLVGLYAHRAQQLLIAIFRATSSTPRPRPAAAEHKVLEAGWFAKEEALRSVTHPREHDALEDALSDAREVIYRAYE